MKAHGQKNTSQPLVTVICDNYTTRDDLEASWGFACLIAQEGKNILFDTGSDGVVLSHNMARLGIDPASIDLMMISHQHWDHVGGIYAILSVKRDLRICVPRSFSVHFQEDMKRYGAAIIEADGACEIMPELFTTGEFDGLIPEQAALLRTPAGTVVITGCAHPPAGTVVITGCAHPGIVKIAQTAKTVLPDNELALVMGGFHLLNDGDGDILNVITEFKAMGVRYAAASHCSGERARKLFAREYEDHFISLGAGSIITLKHLKS